MQQCCPCVVFRQNPPQVEVEVEVEADPDAKGGLEAEARMQVVLQVVADGEVVDLAEAGAAQRDPLASYLR